MAELEVLLAPVAEDNVAGPDLSYDQGRQEIESAFEAARLADIGEGEAPDWPAVIRQIEAQSAQTKDAWLAVYLARAGARAQRLDKVATGCAYLAGLFEAYWDSMHPSLEEYGFQGRKGPCESLVSIGEFIGPLRRVVLLEHPRLGRFTCDHVERFALEGESAEDYGLFRAAIEDIDADEIASIMQRLQDIRDSIARVDVVLTAQADGDTGTNFALAYQTIDSVRRALAAVTGADVTACGDSAGSEPQQEPEDLPGGGSGPVSGGRIQSRSDVVRTIDAIVDYYGRQEPGSPIPVVLGRVRNWVNMDFMSILNDISPSSIDDAKRVLTARTDDD